MVEHTHQRIDSHCHLWDLSRGDYDWLDTENPDFQTIARNFSIADLKEADSAPAAAQYVVVQAAATEQETEYLLKLSDQHSEIGGVVGWVDLTGNQAERRLEQFAQNPKFKGIRPMLQDIEDVEWINTAPRSSAIDALVSKGLRFDALVLPQHLSAFMSFASAHPTLPMVIDHAAKPAFAADKSDPRHDMWRTGMALLANETNAFCKISGLLTELSPEQRVEPEKTLQPVIDNLLNWFGPNRLMWGSDWPVLRLASDYSNWRSLSNTLLSELDDASLARIYADNAKEFYAL